jgi:hypothetical protein
MIFNRKIVETQHPLSQVRSSFKKTITLPGIYRKSYFTLHPMKSYYSNYILLLTLTLWNNILLLYNNNILGINSICLRFDPRSQTASNSDIVIVTVKDKVVGKFAGTKFPKTPLTVEGKVDNNITQRRGRIINNNNIINIIIQ